jgi:hypothetical protein
MQASESFDQIAYDHIFGRFRHCCHCCWALLP